MSVAGAIKAGAAYVEVMADNNPLSKGLRQTETLIKGWGSKLKGMGGKAFGGAFESLGELGGGIVGNLAKLATSPAGMFGGMVAAALKAAEGGAAMLHLSKMTGIATEQLGTLKYAAEQSGIGTEGLAAGMRHLQKAEVDAMSGGKESMLAFAKLGVNFRDLQNLSPDEQLRTVSRAIAAIQNPAEKTALAMKIFGRSGAEMVEFADDLDKLEARAKELGFTGMTREAAESRKQFSMMVTDVKLLGSAIMSSIGGAVIPILKEYTGYVIQGAVKVRDWIKEHKTVVQAAFQLSAAVVGAGGSLVMLGVGLGKISSLLGIAGRGFGLLASVASGGLGILGSVLGVVLSPVGLIAAAVAGLAAGFLYFSETGSAAVRSLMSVVMPIFETLKETFGGITTALSNGEWLAAGQIAVTGLKLAFLQGLSAIQANFSGTFTNILNVIGRVGDGIVSAWNTVTGFLSGLWKKWGQGILNDFVGVMARIPDIWQQTVEGMANWMLAQSAKGGVMGKVWSKMLGVDMADMKQRAKAEEEVRRPMMRRLLQGNIEQAQRGLSGKASAEELRQMNIHDDMAPEEKKAKLQGALDQWQKELAALQGPGQAPDIMADARKAVTQYADELRKSGVVVDSGSGVVSNALGEFAAKLSSGESIEDAKAELARLVAEQKSKAEETKKTEDKKKETAGVMSAGARETAGTFTASVAGLITGGDNPQQQVADNTARQIEILSRMERIDVETKVILQQGGVLP